MPRRKTQEEFIEDARKVHGDSYIYNNTIYVDSYTPISIECRDHGFFLEKPVYHLKGKPCPQCDLIIKNNIKIEKCNNFIVRANELHNNKYTYEKAIYINWKDKVIITCPIHGDFEQSFSDHLSPRGCLKCAITYRADIRKDTLEEFIEKAIQIHGHRYNYKNSIYISCMEKIEIICVDHGSFWQRPNDHTSGKQGCPSCGFVISRPETEWLDYLGIPHEYRQPKKMRLNNKRFKPDAYDPINNCIIEFLGDYFHGNPKIFNLNDMNKMVKKTFGELYKNTMQRIEDIKNAGYDIIYIWENDWNNIKKGINI